MPDDRGDDAPEHLRGLEPDEREHLPGLEPDEPQSVDSTPPEQPDPAPRSESPASVSSRSSERYGEGKWTNEELDSWWHNDGGEARYDAARSNLRFGQEWREKTDFGKTVDGIDEELEAMEETDLESHLPEEERSDDALLSEAFLSGEAAFSRLRGHEKAAIRDDLDALDSKSESNRLYEFGRTPEWEPVPDPVDPAPREPSETGWDSPAELLHVTLPDGSEGTIEVDKEAAMQRVVDGDGNVGEWQPIEVIPDDLIPPPTKVAPSTEPASQADAGFGGFKMIVIGGVATVVAGVIAFLALGGGGGDASGPWSVTDPQNDFAPTFADKEAIANPSAAGDVTGLDVAIADGNTTVTVTFAGAAEGLMAEGGEELAAALQFIPVGDERWIDILFNEDGSVKISDAPSGSRITATWGAANVLVFEITGVTPASGATVRFATIQRDGFAHSTDEVSLAAGDANAVVATAFVTDDSGGDGGVPEAPVIVAACSVIPVELVSAAFGPAVLESAGGDRTQTSRCRYEVAGADIRLDLLVRRQSNPRAQLFRTFRDGHDQAGEIRSIDWGVEGELRITEDVEWSTAALLVYVHSSDPVGREIYVRIDALGPPGQGAALAAAIEPMAELLRDAILEAQP